MGADLKAEVARLQAEGKSHGQIRVELEGKGFATDEIAGAISAKPDRTLEERKNSRALATREVFDRIGYGAAAPQFVNILFWLSQLSHPLILPLIGLLNGIKTVLSVIWSGILQEYAKLHRTSKNTIAAAGIIFGFSFLFMSIGILLRNGWGMLLFSASFLLGTVGVVAYGDLYQKFVRDTIRKERMGAILRTISTWGVLLTAGAILLSGFLIDAFPMAGVPVSFTLFGKAFHLKVFGYLLSFEITTFAFIIAGYVSSLVVDKREEATYSFRSFLREHWRSVRGKLRVFNDKYVTLLLIATVISGFLQIVITAYSGIAIYQYLDTQYAYPFFALGIIYSIAIIASFTGPFFIEKVQRSTGLAPTLVFATLLMAILPLVLVYNMNIVAITAALSVYVIGGAIMGFAQGLLAQRLMGEEARRDYFQAQGLVIIIPYLILIPLLAAAAYYWKLSTLFLIVAAGMIIIVMPIYFVLVAISQKVKL